MIKVDVNEVLQLLKRRSEINNIPLQEIEWKEIFVKGTEKLWEKGS